MLKVEVITVDGDQKVTKEEFVGEYLTTDVVNGKDTLQNIKDVRHTDGRMYFRFLTELKGMELDKFIGDYLKFTSLYMVEKNNEEDKLTRYVGRGIKYLEEKEGTSDKIIEDLGNIYLREFHRPNYKEESDNDIFERLEKRFKEKYKEYLNNKDGIMLC